MTRQAKWGLGLACFLGGTFAHAAVAQRNPGFNEEMFVGKAPTVAATAMLERALELAGSGSWERIAVGRAWYLGGDKARGERILNEVTTSPRVESSDWFRVGRIYAEAGEWSRAEAAFDRALKMKARDDTGMIEYGGLANIHKDRAKAELLFIKALTKNPREFWHWVNAGGSYLGVPAQ